MDSKEFRKNAHQLVDWMADYFEQVESYPVKSQVSPGDIVRQLPVTAPVDGESFESIFDDFNDIIIPGITHWQHPKFMAYFPANNSYPSVLAEMLTATIGAQCMSWQTSPAATELEEVVMGWLKDLFSLPNHFEGVIETGASAATFSSLLSARERATEFRANCVGLSEISEKFTLYCSTEAHSSIERAIRMSGLGDVNLRKIPVNDQCQLMPDSLEKQIDVDIAAGFTPLWMACVMGSTSTTAVDDIDRISKICKKHNIWVHVDGAYAGACLLLPEFKWMAEGLENVDSFVMNPHKWLFTNFDCSAYFVKDKETLIKTYEILPEYLKTQEQDVVNNYRDWGSALGRRFRALKLWFVLRSFGKKGLQEKLRGHLELTKFLKHKICEHKNFELLAPVQFNLVCFRYCPELGMTEHQLTEVNQSLLNRLNLTGSVYLTHTKIHGKYSLRLVIGQTHVEKKHVEEVWNLILKTIGET